MLLSSTSGSLLPARRIISLVPSQTELLYHLGLEAETIGITKFCVHPATWFKTKSRVGGTKSIDIQKIINLKPDLVIANKEENIREQVEEIAHRFPVWVSNVNNLDDACDMIRDVGELTGKRNDAQDLVSNIETGFSQLVTPRAPIPACYLIWKDPYMTVGGDTFINDMMEKAGLTNVFSSNLRYPQITGKDIRQSGCRLLLLSSEPFPFKQKHINELRQQLPGVIIKLADGEMFSWYGSRLLAAPAYFKTLFTELEGELHKNC